MDKRLISLDAFRGFTIAAMLLVNNPGDWAHLYPQLAHAAWHGWTFTDWIFPFFLFISGMSMVLAIDAKFGATKRTALQNRQLTLTLWRRGATIVLIGLCLHLVPQFDLSTLRWPGVLQRIGLCTIVAAPFVVYFGWRTHLWASVVLCVIYSIGMQLIAVPDANGAMHTGSLEPGQDFGAYVDRALMSGHLWAKAKTWDPEGLWSTLPSVASLLMGSVAGHWLLNARERTEKTVWMLLIGLLALWLGAMLDAVHLPINKQLWTPSYMVFMTGWALIVFSVFYWLMDAAPQEKLRRQARAWLAPMTIYGLNAMFLFVLSGLVARMLNTIKLPDASGTSINLKTWLYVPIKALPVEPINASLIYAVIFNLCFFAIAYGMWKKRWFIKV
jgi:predicted acyltransferase